MGALLVDEVCQAGGVLVVPARQEDRYRRRVELAIRGRHVPGDRILFLERRGRDASAVRLTPTPEWMTQRRAPVPVPATLRGVAPAVAQLRDDPERVPLARPARQQCLLIAQALTTEGARRGLAVSTSPERSGSGGVVHRRHPLLALTQQGHEFLVLVEELTDRVVHEPTAQELRQAARPWAPRLPTHDHVPNGRIALLLQGGWQQGQSTWKRTTPEELPQTLADLLHEVDLRAAEAERTRIAREEAQARRQRDWQAAMTTARHWAVDAHRTAILDKQLDAWARVQRLDAYISKLSAAVAVLPDASQRTAAEPWLAWVRAHRDAVDPLLQPVAMPPDPGITPELLRPHLGRWSPYGPEHGF